MGGGGGALSRVPKTRALYRGLGVSSPRKVSNLEANNLFVFTYKYFNLRFEVNALLSILRIGLYARFLSNTESINQSVNII